MPKNPSKRQVRYLLSKGSPLTPEQKSKMKRELHSGKMKVKKGSKPKGGKKTSIKKKQSRY